MNIRQKRVERRRAVVSSRSRRVNKDKPNFLHLSRELNLGRSGCEADTLITKLLDDILAFEKASPSRMPPNFSFMLIILGVEKRKGEL